MGVYKSINAGENWNMANSGISNSQITTLVLDPMTPSTLYAGTSGEGIYKSVDGGLNWKAVNSELPNTISIKKITINPQWPKIIYMCTYGPSEKFKSGVYKSIDGGENWIYLGLGDIALSGLVIFPNTPSILYVGSEKGIYSLQQ